MTTLVDRPNTALLVIDVQNGVVADAYDRDAVVANIATVVAKARSAGVPVVWVQHHDDDLPRDSENWQYVPELVFGGGEAVVHKHYGDSFEQTDLESVLAAHGIGRLVVAGAQTDQCIRSTLHGAIVRGYDATLVADAHDRGPLVLRRAPAGAGHRPHQPVLDLPRGSRSHRRHRHHRRRRLHRGRAEGRGGLSG